MTNTEVSDKCKLLESVTDIKATEKGCIMIRLDGRAFHTYTTGLKRPYDERLSSCMVDTTKTLVEDCHAIVGYTQSDEINLLLYADPEIESSDFPFGGRYMKLSSVYAGMASSCFAVLSNERIEERKGYFPHFDGRAYSLTKEEAVMTLNWRVRDAYKNSVTMAAQSVYSHKQLLNKHTDEKLRMLKDKGIDWVDYPQFFKLGTFVKRCTVDVELTEKEYMMIPEKHRPASRIVKRSKVLEIPNYEHVTWDWLIS
jgi:tRNA(His) guanylyltransferase